jgi:response regulator RpfG family c-di-GMP phosphodiesterase
MAKMLELTAKQMASREVPKYFPVPVRLLKKMSKTQCDLYSREAKDDFDFSYTKILDKDTLFGELIKKFSDEDVEHLFIDAGERLKFINKVSGFIINEFSKPDLTLDETIEITAQGQSMVAEEIFENQEISDAVAEVSKSCVQAMVKVVKEVPKLRNLLAMLLENKSNFVFKHGIIASYVADQIIENISWGSKEQMEKVTFSLFFHDLFLVPIFAKFPDVQSEEDLLFHDGVSDEEKETVLNHAKLAGSILQSFPRAPMGADMIITQHHGMTNGRGFGINFKDDISPLAKIIVIAEDVATGILADIADGKKKSSLDIQRIMKRLNDRYTYNSYKKIILTLENLKI